MNARLVRVGFVVVAPALAALLFAVSAPGTLPRAPLEPLFDTAAAAALARTLSTEYPSRVPGTLEADGAARWIHETIAALGLTTEDDAWTEDLPDLGRVTLRNIVTVVPGRSDETVVVVAHRDNAGPDLAWIDNASGSAALIELARGFAPQESAPDPRPQRTLVLVSTDAGAYGGAGASRFADVSPYAANAVAAIVLDGISGGGTPAIAVAGDTAVSPAPRLVRTASARIEEETGTHAALPSLAAQLVGLATPYAADEQGRLLGRGIASVAITTGVRGAAASLTGEPLAGAGAARLGRLGRATESLVDSLDTSAGGRLRTPDALFFGDRALSGWAVRLTLVLLVVPFSLGLADLLARVRRRRLRLAPALRGQGIRLGVWLFAGILVAAGALTAVFPTGAPLPLPAFSEYVTDPSVAGLVLLGSLFALVWLIARRRLAPTGKPSPDEQLAGLTVALALLGLVALVLAATRPYALLFVLPSLYTWLWISPEDAPIRRIALFLIGLAVPALGLLVLTHGLGLSAGEAPLYAIGLVTVGYIPVGSALLALVWVAVAAQIGAVAFGRYAPHQSAGGRRPRQRRTYGQSRSR